MFAPYSQEQRARLGAGERELAGKARGKGSHERPMVSCMVARCACCPLLHFWGTSLWMAIASNEHSGISFTNTHSNKQ